MTHVGLDFYWPDDFDLHGIEPVHLRKGLWVKLPFRLRTGQFFHLVMEDSGSTEIWIYNRSHIPAALSPESRSKEAFERDRTDRPLLWSDAILIFKNLKIDPQSLNKIKTTGEYESPVFEFEYFAALQALNEFICTYVTATKQMFGGSSLAPLTDMEFFQALYAEMTLVCPTNYVIGERELLEIVQWRPEREVLRILSVNGDIHDLPIDQSKFTSTLNNVRQHAFYELAFKARVESIARDPILAVVLACAALEGAHAAFLFQSLEKKFDEDTGRIVSSLLREQGIHTLLQVTPRLFLPQEQQPSEAVISNCTKAVEARNTIVHSKSKKGIYGVRKLNASELNAHVQALLAMYEVFESALQPI